MNKIHMWTILFKSQETSILPSLNFNKIVLFLNDTIQNSFMIVYYVEAGK